MKKQVIFVLLIAMFSLASFAEASELLEDGKKSFMLVLEDIYKEMGSPEMTVKVADKMDRLIFMRDSPKEPAFAPNVNISWGSYKNSITAIISGEEYGAPVKVRVLWRPGQELEILDPDVVLKR